MLAAGASVVFVDRDKKALRKLNASRGERAVPLVIDLLDAASCDSLLEGILKMAGRLDVLHANAGSYIGGVLTEANHVLLTGCLISTSMRG